MGLIRQDYIFYLNTINFPDEGVYVFGGYGGGQNIIGVAAENNNQGSLPIDVQLVQCEARMAVTGTLGSNELMTVQLYMNSGAGGGALIEDLTLNQRINYASNRALAYDITTSDYFDFLITCPAWTTNPTASMGLILTCYFDTGLDRQLSYQRFYGHVGFNGVWNPATRAGYYLGTGTGIVSLTNDMPLCLPYDGLVVAADLNCRNNGTGSADAVITELDVGGIGINIDNTWQWNGGSDIVLKGLDSLAIPFSALQPIAPVLNTPNWSVPPQGTSQSIGLLIERT